MQFFNNNASKPADATEAHAASAPEVPCALGCPKNSVHLVQLMHPVQTYPANVQDILVFLLVI